MKCITEAFLCLLFCSCLHAQGRDMDFVLFNYISFHDVYHLYEMRPQESTQPFLEFDRQHGDQ